MTLSLRTSSLALAALLAFSACPPTPAPTPLTPNPRIVKFDATPRMARAGETVTLSWETADATEVNITEARSGALPAVTETTGQTTFVLEGDGLFILTALNARGATDVAALSVRAEGVTTELLLVSSATVAAAGEAVTLAWSAPGADVVTLTANPGGVVDLGSATGSGTVVVRPTATTTYTLEAGGRQESVTVAVEPRIVRFEATPTSPAAGSTITLSWETLGASRIEVLTPGRAPLFDSADGGAVAPSGSVTDVLPTSIDPGQRFTYQLRITDGAVTRTREVMVAVAGIPLILTFVAPPLARSVDGGTMEFSWTTVETDEVSLSQDGVEIYRSPTRAQALSGSTLVPVPAALAPATWTLTARSTGGLTATETVTVDVVGAPAVNLAASSSQVAGGDAVTLTWQGENLRNVTLTGSRRGLVLQRGGQPNQGQATVRVNADETFTIRGDNGLGETSTSTAMVAVPSPVTLSVTMPPGTPRAGQLFEVTASRAGQLKGLPHRNVVSRPNSTGFIDITETGTKVSLSSSPYTTKIVTDFRTTLFGRVVGDEISVADNGVLVFGPWVNGLNSTVVAQPTTKLETMAVAPYWSSMTSVSFYWEVRVIEGAPTLIAMWQNTSNTFEAKISSTGQIDFEYAELPANPSAGRTVITGPTLAQNVVGPAPAVGTGLTFFGALAQPAQVPFFEPGPVRATLEIAPGEPTRVEGTLTAELVRPGDVRIVEAQALPPLGPDAQWVEIANWRDTPVSLEGWTLNFPDGGVATTLSGTVPARGALVVGGSTDPTLNDDAGVAVAWSNVDLGAITQLRLEREGAYNAMTLTLPNGTRPAAGTTISYDSGPYRRTGDTGNFTFYCSTSSTYGFQTPLQRGTPGRDVTCNFPYTLTSIRGGYFDIADPTTALVFAETDDALATVNLALAPVNFFGTARTSLVVSTNGYASFDPSSVVANEIFDTTSPLPGQTNAVAAIMAQDLMLNSLLPGSNVYARRVGQGVDPFAAAPHWIIQWHHVSYYTTSTTSRDDYNFQLKLFDDGTIEYHYGDMRSVSSSQHASGANAVTWLENPAGSQALVVNIKSTNPGLQPHTAYRFTPR